MKKKLLIIIPIILITGISIILFIVIKKSSSRYTAGPKEPTKINQCTKNSDCVVASWSFCIGCHGEEAINKKYYDSFIQEESKKHSGCTAACGMSFTHMVKAVCVKNPMQSIGICTGICSNISDDTIKECWKY